MSNNEIREKRKKVICDLVKDDFYVPMKEKELAIFLQVAKEDREEFRDHRMFYFRSEIPWFFSTERHFSAVQPVDWGKCP